MNLFSGLKKFFPILIILLSVRLHVSAQLTKEDSTSSPQVRNTLQLLDSSRDPDKHFQKMNKRIKALINRLNKINTRIKSRINKLKENKTILNLLNSQLDGISARLADLDKQQSEIEDSWKALLLSKDSQDYQTLKKNLKQVVDSIKTLINDEEGLIKELKKYRSVVEPTEKVAVPAL